MPTRNGERRSLRVLQDAPITQDMQHACVWSLSRNMSYLRCLMCVLLFHLSGWVANLTDEAAAVAKCTGRSGKTSHSDIGLMLTPLSQSTKPRNTRLYKKKICSMTQRHRRFRLCRPHLDLYFSTDLFNSCVQPFYPYFWCKLC